MQQSNANLLLHTPAQLGEGAIWNSQTQLLYWVDINGKTVNIYNPTEKTNTCFNVFKRPGTVIPIDSENVLVALEDGLVTLNIQSGKIVYQLQTPQFETNSLRFNDGKCDKNGRFWVGTMDLNAKKEAGVLYSLQNNFILKPEVSKTTISNGIAWNADDTKMYYIDTTTSNISCFDYDLLTGNIKNRTEIIAINPNLGYPDGMTIDNQGMLWVALWDGFAVACFNPNTGEMLHKVNIPAPKITSCAFGGEKLDTLFITTARVDMSADELEKYPLSGSLFYANTGSIGVEANAFKMNH